MWRLDGNKRFILPILLILIAACPPGSYWSRHGTRAPWTDAIFRIDEKYPSVRGIIGNANLKALVTVGSKQYHKLQLAENKKDVSTIMQPENVVELDYALESATAVGLSSILEDIRVLFTDYSKIISESNCQVFIIHGEKDPMFPIEGLRNLKTDYPDRVELHEIEDAGFTVFLSHSKEVVKILSSVANNSDKPLAQSKYKTG